MHYTTIMSDLKYFINKKVSLTGGDIEGLYYI